MRSDCPGPSRTVCGAVVLGARASGPGGYQLFWATYDGEWQRFAELVLGDEPAADQHISFDPVRHRLPGLEQYPVVVRLREPAYRTARKSRRDQAGSLR